MCSRESQIFGGSQFSKPQPRVWPKIWRHFGAIIIFWNKKSNSPFNSVLPTTHVTASWHPVKINLCTQFRIRILPVNSIWSTWCGETALVAVVAILQTCQKHPPENSSVGHWNCFSNRHSGIIGVQTPFCQIFGLVSNALNPSGLVSKIWLRYLKSLWYKSDF